MYKNSNCVLESPVDKTVYVFPLSCDCPVPFICTGCPATRLLLAVTVMTLLGVAPLPEEAVTLNTVVPAGEGEAALVLLVAMLLTESPVISAVTKLRNVGMALAPETGPAHTVLAACASRVNVNAGVLVGFVTEAVAMPPILAALYVVTLPTPYSCAFTKAVVANSVLLSAVAGVGAVGVPVNAGDANGAAPVI